MKSLLRFTGESKYMTLRLALGMSSNGFLGLMLRKMIKVAIPEKIRVRLNIRQSTAPNHITGFVLLGGLSNGCTFVFLELLVYGKSSGDCFWFMSFFDIMIWF